ncbi:hypothetical protein [Levilactobacillus brevis]|uniref:hypothetical protein n=1 Tax=Levilactobacillus brevis TaxID=1580 RepID=UPI003F4AD168
MQSSLKKSLYLGLAALSFAGVAAVSTTASAKSYATAGAYTTLKTDATKRNVEATGTNALYTKPGTVKGAKVVASKATMAKLASSKKSADYFRAYGVKTTNRGSVYYRVVSMDGKYRGYIYGGKSDTAFAGGIKSAETTTKATMPTNTTVYFKTPGKTNVTWTAPKNTQYKASKMVTDTTPFAADKLTITDAATKTREGSLYYYVKDATNPSVSGWIYSGAVTTDSSVAYNQASDVKVNFVATDGTTVKSTVLQNLKTNNASNTASTSDVAKVKGTAVGVDALAQAKAANYDSTVLKGTGYSVGDLTTNTVNQAALYNAKTGDTVTLYVTKGQESAMTIKLYQTTSDASTNTALVPSTSANASSADVATVVKVPALTTPFAGAAGATFTASDVMTYLTNNKAATLYTDNYTTSEDGKTNTAVDANADAATLAKASYTEYTLKSSRDGVFGTGSAEAIYTGTVKTGVSPVHSTNNNNGSSVFE